MLQSARTILCAHGILITKRTDGVWTVPGLNGSALALDSVTFNALGLQPVLVDYGTAAVPLPLLVPSVTGKHLDVQPSDMRQQIYRLHSGPYFTSTRGVFFLVSSSLYHLKQLAWSYTNVLDSFRLGPPEILEAPRVVMAADEAHFEFEALVSEIVRLLDMTRYPLWRRYGTAGSVPTSFGRTCARCTNLPQWLRSTLDHALTDPYATAKAYRDCLHHYVDVSSSSHAYAHHVAGVTHGLIVRVPDNPEARSAARFTFERDLDALRLAWGLVSNAVAVVAHIIAGLTAMPIESGPAS